MVHGKNKIGKEGKSCSIIDKSRLEGMNRLDLWGMALDPKLRTCRETSFLAAKVYAEKYVKGKLRESDYYSKDLTDAVINSIDDSGNIKTKDKDKIRKIVAFVGMMYME